MIIYDDIYTWEGYGGKLRLTSGRCRLRIIDLNKGDAKSPAHLRPIVVIISDLPRENFDDMSIRSCAGHIATGVSRDFNIDPNRMLFVGYTPETVYGVRGENRIPEKFDAVDFQWRENKALFPKWRTLKPPIHDIIKELLS